MAKKKPATKKPAAKKATRKPAAKSKAAKQPEVAPAAVEDASAALQEMGFFRGAYNWEADREVPALRQRVRILVDHTGGVVAPVQVRALELLLESEADLRALALKASYECMLHWVETFRKRHPEFKGKPIAEKPFNRGCELGSAFISSPDPKAEKPAPAFLLDVYWPEDDGHPCKVAFEWQRDAWVVTSAERN
jgi:hypothetical protein